MNSTNLAKFAMTGFSLALLLGGCGSSGGGGNPGTGGTSTPGTGGSGGTNAGTGGSGTGGTTGTGGTSGATGSGGSATGSGGSATGSGGSATGGTGGATGSGGSGGATGSGGRGGATAGSGGGGGSAGSGGGAGSGTGGRGGSAGGAGGSGGTGGATGSGGAGTFSLTSPNQMDGAKFDTKYTCNGAGLGAGVIPELDWTGVPAGTKSLTLTFIDTTLGDSSPMGQHWAMYNIPWNASTGVVSKIAEGTKTLTGDLANAKQVAPVNNGAFLAPCATKLTNNMDDQYAFTLYALSTDTLPNAGTSVASIVTALKAVTPLGKAVLTGHAGLNGK